MTFVITRCIPQMEHLQSSRVNPAWIATSCMSRSVRCALVTFSIFRTQSSQYALPAFVPRKSAARFLCRMLLPNGVGICGSYQTTVILGPARPPGKLRANKDQDQG